MYHQFLCQHSIPKRLNPETKQRGWGYELEFSWVFLNAFKSRMSCSSSLINSVEYRNVGRESSSGGHMRNLDEASKFPLGLEMKIKER